MAGKIASRKKLTTELALLIVYIAIVIVFSILSPYFFTLGNFMKLLLYAAQMGVLAGGMTLVLLSGGIDVSVGSVMALVGIICGLVLQAGGNTAMAVLAGLAVGAACGFTNGFIITVFRVNAFITTLGTMTIFRGLARSSPTAKPSSFRTPPTMPSAGSTFLTLSPFRLF